MGAQAVAFNDEGKILLIKREDVQCWHLPGGGIEPGETIAETAVREVKEETGLEVRMTRLVGIYCRPNWYRGGDHCAVFAAEYVGGKLQMQTTEVIDAGFYAPENLPSPLIWWAERRIADAISGKTGLVCLQDAVWPFDPKLSADQVREQMRDSVQSPPDFYETHFATVGNLGEVEQLAGLVSPRIDRPRARDVSPD